MSTKLLKTKYRPTKGFIATVLQDVTGKNVYDLVVLTSALAMNLHKINKGKKTNYFVEAITYLESGEVNIEDAELLLIELITERLFLKTGKAIVSDKDEFVDELLDMFLKDSANQTSAAESTNLNQEEKSEINEGFSEIADIDDE